VTRHNAPLLCRVTIKKSRHMQKRHIYMQKRHIRKRERYIVTRPNAPLLCRIVWLRLVGSLKL